MLKVPDQGVGGEEMVPDEEYELQEGPELYCPAEARVLSVFAGPEAEVEFQLGWVGDVLGLWVIGGGPGVHNGLYNAQGGGFSPLDWRIFGAISFELAGKVHV